MNSQVTQGQLENSLIDSNKNPRQSEIIKRLKSQQHDPKQLVGGQVASLTSQIMNRTTKPKTIEIDPEKAKRSAIIIESRYRTFRARVKYLPMRKQHRYRKNVIAEILHTEEAYVRDLSIVIEEVYIPLKRVLKPEQMSQVFSNMKEIQGLNESLMMALQSKFDKFWPYQVTFDCLVSFLPFFKLYFQYCTDFDRSVKTRQQLASAEYCEIVATARKKPVMRSMDKIMDNFLKSAKVFELQKTFGDPNHITLVHQNRTFIMEETLTLYKKGNDHLSVICYFLSDIILVTVREFLSILLKKSEPTYKVYKVLYLNETSQCKDMPDSKYYQNMFKVVAKNDLMTFIAHDKDSRQKCVKAVQETINDIRQQKGEKFANLNNVTVSSYHKIQVPKVSVAVLGTEEFNAASLNKYTIYIVEITIKHITQKLYLRYSQIRFLEGQLRTKFPKVKLPHFTVINWLQNHSTKLLEQRKIQIENFLQIAFDDPEIQAQPTEMLTLLGLPMNFFQLHMLVEEEPTLVRHQSLQDNSIVEMISAKDIRPAHLQLEQNFQQKLYEAQVIRNSIKNTQISKIYVFLPNNKRITIEVDWQEKAMQVCEKVAQDINLAQFYDFKLFVSDDKDNLRVIEDEQLMLNSLPRDCSQIWVNENQGLWKKITSSISQPFDQRYRVVLRKYYTFNQQIEEAEFRGDKVRLDLIVAQYLEDIRKSQYPLTSQQYSSFATLLLYIQCDGLIQQYLEELPKDTLAGWIGMKRYKQYTDAQWANQITKQLMQFDEKLTEIVKSNDRTRQSVLETVLLTKVEYAQMVCINMLRTQATFGTTLFYVSVSQSVITKYPELKFPCNVYLAIGYQKILVLSPTRSNIINQAQLNQLVGIHAFPSSITFEINSRSLKFKTIQSYQIQQLINEYLEVESNV